MAKNIEVLFPTYVYRSSLAGSRRLNSRLEGEIIGMLDHDKVGLKWSRGHYRKGYTSFGSSQQLHKTSETFSELMTQIRPHVDKFLKQLRWQIAPQELQVSNCWANAMGRGSRHPMHTHPRCMISGVYYINAPKGSAPFVVEDPRTDFYMAVPMRAAGAPRRDQRQVALQPRAGDLILFESWLKHEVPEHFAKEPRLSVAFNFSELMTEVTPDSALDSQSKVRRLRHKRVLNDSSL